MSIKEVIRAKSAASGVNPANYHATLSVEDSKSIRVIKIGGIDRCVILPEGYSIGDPSVIYPAFCGDDSISKAVYEKNVKELDGALDTGVFLHTYVVSVIESSGLKIDSPIALNALSDLSRLEYLSYDDMSLDIIESIIPSINSIFSNGRVSLKKTTR